MYWFLIYLIFLPYTFIFPPYSIFLYHLALSGIVYIDFWFIVYLLPLEYKLHVDKSLV